MCFIYLFHKGKKKLSPLPPDFEYLYQPMQGNYTSDFIAPTPADISNATFSKLICSTLSGDECYRWTQCCQAADACCRRQLGDVTGSQSDETQCERTWDGYSCWDDTPSGTEVTTQCPSFMMAFSLARGKTDHHCLRSGIFPYAIVCQNM